MLFNSLPFLLFFLPGAFAGFYLCARLFGKLAIGWLVGVSLFFYGWWNPAYLILLCSSIVFNYGCGLLILRPTDVPRESFRQGLLVLGVGCNLLLLGYYKYLFPLLHGFEHFGFHLVRENASVVLPLGISFFTFTQIGYLVDCKAGMASGRRFIDYVLFVTFFPHLIAGPILHQREMLPQFSREETYHIKAANLAVGVSIFIVGLAKKVLVADSFAVHANALFTHSTAVHSINPPLIVAWLGSMSFAFQLYFDFSGYSDMAVGLARMFNVRFPANFDSPYRSTSIIEYWQRFHMTLTRFLNLYLYNPIALWITRRNAGKSAAGSKGTKTASGFASMVIFPTFFTMFLAGIWHGAGLQFIIFGVLHGIYLSINRTWRQLFHRKGQPEATGLSLWFETAWKISLTCLAVLIADIFFRAQSVADGFSILRSMFLLNGGSLPGNITRFQAAFAPAMDFPFLRTRALISLMVALPFVWTMPNVLQLFSAWEPTFSTPRSASPIPLKWRPTAGWAVFCGFLVVVAVLEIIKSGHASPFLYFQF